MLRFTKRVLTQLGNGSFETDVEFVIDDDTLAETIGRQAVANKTQRSIALKGAIVAEVRKGSKKAVDTT
jgi:hypothetical protein